MAEEFIASTASNLVAKLAEHLFAPIGRQFGYVLCYESNIEDLKKRIRDLEYATEQVQCDVDDAVFDEKTIRSYVKDWLLSAKENAEEATKLLERNKSAKNAYCHGWVPNPMVRHPIGRSVKKMTRVIQGLIAESQTSKFLKVYKENTPAGIVKRTPSIARPVDQKEHVLESRASIIEEVLKAITDDKPCMIGVWGPGGVGKSKLLEDVEKRVREDTLFDWVAKADVTRDLDLKRIQGEIADALGLKMTIEETVRGRASRLCKRLERNSRKRILIILDNLWTKLDLKKVGIPHEDNKVRSCKLLLTSRYRRVLTDMDSDREILLKKLDDEEARELFERIVGEKINDPQFKLRVDGAVKCCGGLPLLIDSLAKRLKKGDLAAWKNPSTNIDEPIVRSLVELNYNDLKDDRIKSLFFVCALTSGRILMKNSLVYCMGLGLYDLIKMDGFGSIEKVREFLIADLNSLRDSSLLLDSDDMEWFKMHDKFVDVAVSIASTEWNALVGGINCGSQAWPKDKLRKCTAISSRIDELPEKLSCPNLRMLLLSEDNSSLRISDSFFKSMKKLQVLDLTGLSFTFLPSSFKFLGILKSLCLGFCHLEDVTILGKLEGLQFLSFLHSTINRLPKEIGGLTKLRFLDLTGCIGLKVIEPGVLQSLVHLEELYMEDSFDQWEAENESLESNASLAELKNMEKLSTLYIAIPHSANRSRDLPFGKLKNHKIQIGDVWDWSGEYKESRTLKLKVDADYLLEEWVQKCLRMTEDLHLDGLQDVNDSINNLCNDGFEKLKHLHVQNSPSFQYVVHCTCPAFMRLESLFLHNLNNFKKICLGCLAQDSFSKLKIVKVDNCGEIKHLFPLSMMRIFLQLEEIVISKCHLMEQIVADVEEYDDEDELLELKEMPSSQFPLDGSKLRILKVEDCMLILSIIPSNVLMKLQNLEAITIERCQSIQVIFNLEGLTGSGDVKILSRLTKLTLCDLPSLGHICKNNPRKALCFPNLRALNVQNCENLRFLFSPYMAKALKQIEEIEIASCKLMEEIMDVQEEELEEVATTSTLEFPLLTSLSLEELPNLKTFSSGKYYIHCPSLTRLRISKCPKMMAFSSFKGKQQLMTIDTSLQQPFGCINSQSSLPIFFNQNVLFPSLEELKLLSCGLKRIWPNELPAESFHKLASITVEDCENLSHIFPSNDTTKTLDKLEMLNVSGCNNMRQVVVVEECEELKLEAVKFSNLRTLILHSLESLISFSSRSCAYEFPSLKEFTVEDCKAVEVIVEDASHIKVEGNIPMQQSLLLVKKVKFPSTESMKISHMDNMGKIWLDDLASNNFSKLKMLTVEYCHKLSVIFSSDTILAKFQNLEKLTVTDCSSLKVVFHVQEFNFSEVRSVSTFQLRELVLEQLSNMTHVWSGLPQGALNFGCLQRIEARECNSLKSLFPSWVAKSMTRIEEIDVSFCGVEEIVAEEDGDVGTSACDLFFPRLTTLRLVQLPELRSFYKNSHILTWPSLKILRVKRCGKMRSFSFDCETQSGQGSTASENQLGLLSVEKVIPHLEHIKLEGNNVVMMQKISDKRRELFVEDAVGYGGPTPWEVLTDMGIPLAALRNLKGLSLIKLFPSVSTGFPSPTLFQSLTELIVERSYGLVHLGTRSALTNLGHLTRLVLRDCDAMEDVVIDDGNVAEEISFPKLEELILDGLPSLKFFSPMNCTFMFPSLVRLIVKQCPKLTIFCEGALRTPKLVTVLLSEKEDEGYWDSDLNTTIQTL